MSFADNYLKLREQRQSITGKDTGGSTPPVSSKTENSGNSFTDNYLELRQQRSILTQPERQTYRSQNTAHARSGLTRNEFDSRVRENYARQNRLTTGGGFYSMPEFGRDEERLRTSATAAQQDLESKQSALESATATVEEAKRSMDFVESHMNQLYSNYQSNPTQHAADLYKKAYGAYKTRIDEYNTAVDSYNSLRAEYEPLLSEYNTAAGAYNDYMARQAQEYFDWKGTIRSAEDIQADIAAQDSQIAALKERQRELNNEASQIMSKVSGRRGGNQELAEWGRQADALREQAAEVQAQITGMENMKALLAEELDWAEHFRYEEFRSAPDFGEKSVYVSTETGEEPVRHPVSNLYINTGFGDITYDYINRNKEAMNRQLVNDVVATNDALLGLDQSFLQELDDDEISMFNYLYAQDTAKGDTEHSTAYGYIKYLTKSLNYRQRKRIEEKYAKYAADDPVGASVFSILESPLKVLSFLGQMADYAGDGKIDQNAGYNKFSYTSSAIRGQVAQDIEKNVKGFWGKAGSFAYQTGMSMGDFLFNTAITGGNQAVSLGIMGSGAAADTTIALKDAGMSDDRAFILGIIAGVAEMVTEKFSMETLLDKTALGKSAFGYFIKNAVAEGSEEVASDAINWTADWLYDCLTGENSSEFKRMVQAYKDDNMGEQDAVIAAIKDRLIEAGLDLLGGAVSGGTMAGGSIGFNGMINGYYAKKTGAEFHAMGDDVVLATIQEGLASDPNTQSYKLADRLQKKLDNGQTITDAELGKLYQANVRAINDKTGADLIAQADDEMTWRGRITNKTAAEILGHKGAVETLTQEAGLQLSDEMSRAQRRAAVESAVDSYVTAQAEGLKKTGTMTAGTNAMPRAVQTQMRDPGMLPTAEEAEQNARRQRAMEAATTELERSGIEAGVSTEMIQQAQRISKVIGRDVVFYNEAATASGSIRNGYYNPTDGKIHVNAQSQNPLAQIIAHELTHSVELAESYRELRDVVLRRIQKTDDLKQMRQKKAEFYASNGVVLQSEAEIDQEIVAEYVERHLLTNERSIMELTRENRTLGERILQWLNKLLAKLGNTNAQERAFLTQARDAYAKALSQTSFTEQTAETPAPQRQGTQGGTEAMLEALREDYADGKITEEEFDAALDVIMEQESMDDQSMLRKNSFGSVNANGANLETLRQAKEMERQGVAAETIFKETGWYIGADGKWRFEMDDSGMRYNRENEGAQTLADILQHDELFWNYPQLRMTRVEFQDLGRGITGQYNNETDTISLSNELRDAPEGALIHEIQHAIQKAEGFARGANTKFWERQLESGYDGKTQQQRREVQRLWQEYNSIRDTEPDFFAAMVGLEAMAPDMPRGAINWDTLEKIEEDPIEWQRYDAVREKLEEQYGDMKVWDFIDLHYKLKQAEMNAGRSATDLYYDTAGEIEARDTARRRLLTAEQRRSRMPDIGDENTVFAEEAEGGYFSMSADEQAGIREQLRENQDRLNAMEVVGSVNTREYAGLDTRRAREKLVTEMKKTGYKVDRKGFGEIQFEESEINNSLNYKEKDPSAEDARRTGFLVLQSVLKRGIEIDGHDMHKGRNYDTVTIAAPVEINGRRGNMAVVVKRTKGNRYKVHRILTPEGETFTLPEMANAEVNTVGAVTNNSQLLGGSAPAINSASEVSIDGKDLPVKRQLGRRIDKIKSPGEHTDTGEDQRSRYQELKPGGAQSEAEVTDGITPSTENGKDPHISSGFEYSITDEENEVNRELKQEGAQDTQGAPDRDDNLVQPRRYVDTLNDRTEPETEEGQRSAGGEAGTQANDVVGALPVKAQKYLRRTEQHLLNKVGALLGVPLYAQREFLQDIARDISTEYLRTGAVSRETVNRLFERAYSKGAEAAGEYYDAYKDIKDHLRTQPITIEEQDKSDIQDWDSFQKSAAGTLRIVNGGGMEVDVAYAELQTMAPKLFPASITSPADQLMRMFKVGRSIQRAEKTLNEANSYDAEEFKRWGKHDFDAAVNEVLGELRKVKRYADERAQQAEAKSELTQEQVAALYSQLKDARRAYERVAAKNLLTHSDEIQVGRLLRGEIELEHLDPAKDNVSGITAVYEAKQEYERLTRSIREWNQSRKAKLRETADGLLETANSWKDKKAGILYARETMERNVRDIVKDPALADKIIAEYFSPVHEAQAKATRMKNKYRERVLALDLSRKVEKGNLVSEAHAVQLLGEAEDCIRVMEQSKGRIKERDGKTISDWQGVISALWSESPRLDKAKIEAAVKEFRSIYDELFQQMNESRLRNGYEPVNYRSGYFPHFQPGDGDGILSQFGKALGIGMDVSALPTTINGLTHTFKPGIQWFGNAQERLGFNTAYDAVEGFDRYIEGVADVIYQTDNIQKLRALATQARYRTGDEGIRKQVDAVMANGTLDEEDKQNRIKEIYETGRYALNNFVVELEEYTNLLANKKSRADRNMEQMLWRRVYGLMKTLESRVAANMVAVNPASWLTNFIPLTQGNAMLDRGMLLRGMWDTLKAYKTDDGIVAKSAFLTNRRGSNPIVRTWAQAASAKLSLPMEYIDQFTADSLVRARYRQNIKKGLSEDAAMSEADSWVAGVMADRSKGSMPTLFNRSNPLTKLFTQFQLEVNNQLSYLFKDIPRGAGEKGLKALIAALLAFFLGAYLYNEIYEYVIGRRPALDPLGILNDTVGDITGYELPNLVELGTGIVTGDMPSFEVEQKNAYKTAEGLAADVLEELPFIGGVLGGGRLPISSALPNVKNLGRAFLNDDWSAEKRVATGLKELGKPAAYLVPPFGGGQIKKIFQGLRAVIQGGSYSTDPEGNDILQYPVYRDGIGQTILSTAGAVLFGKTSLPTGRDWVESGFKTFSAAETACYQAMLETGIGGEEAFGLLQDLRGAEKTDTESKSAVKRGILRKSDIPDEGKSIVYYGVMASDRERELMDALADGADMGEVTNVLMEIGDAGKLTGAARSNAKRQAIMDAMLTDDEKKLIYRYMMGSRQEDGSYTSGWDDEIMAFEQVGMDFDQFLQTQNEYSTIDEEYSRSGEKAVEFSRWVNSQMLTVEQANTMRDCFGHYTQEAERYNSFVAAGLDDDTAYELVDTLNGLEPPEGEDTVSSLQRYRAVVDAGLTEDEQMAVLATIMPESEYRKLQTGYGFGVTPAAYVVYKELLPRYDTDGNGSFSQKEVEAAIDALGGRGSGIMLPSAGAPSAGNISLTNAEKAALWQMANKSWKPKNNPYDTRVGQRVYEALNAEPNAGGLRLPSQSGEDGGIQLPTAGSSLRLPSQG